MIRSMRVELMLYAGNNLDKARHIFEQTHKQRPSIRLTIRQRMRVLDEWPRGKRSFDASRCARLVRVPMAS